MNFKQIYSIITIIITIILIVIGIVFSLHLHLDIHCVSKIKDKITILIPADTYINVLDRTTCNPKSHQKILCDIHNSSEYSENYINRRLANDILTHILSRNPRLVDYSKISITNHMFNGTYCTKYEDNKANITYSCEKILYFGRVEQDVIYSLHCVMLMLVIIYIVIYQLIEYDIYINILNSSLDIVRFIILDSILVLSLFKYKFHINEYGVYFEKIRTCILVIQIIINMKIKRTPTANSYGRIKGKYKFQIIPLVSISIILMAQVIISLYQFYTELSMSTTLIDVKDINEHVPVINTTVFHIEIWMYIIRYYILGFILELLMYIVRYAFM